MSKLKYLQILTKAFVFCEFDLQTASICMRSKREFVIYKNPKELYRFRSKNDITINNLVEILEKDSTPKNIIWNFSRFAITEFILNQFKQIKVSHFKSLISTSRHSCQF